MGGDGGRVEAAEPYLLGYVYCGADRQGGGGVKNEFSDLFNGLFGKGKPFGKTPATDADGVLSSIQLIRRCAEMRKKAKEKTQ
jgi:hypothetical protein